MTKPLRVRFAPSPTGRLHIGGARTALFNWAYARGRGGKFLLRIEDTDPERSTKEHEVAILDGLRWLGIDWDEGPDVGGPHAPYHQSLRIGRHKERAAELFAAGRAYRCFCSRERLEQLNTELKARKERQAYDQLCRKLSREESDARAARGEPFVLRVAIPAGETRFFDHVRGEMSFQNVEVEDWVMVRSDGNPTYNFVVVCDDIDMQVSHVFRGEEHLVNTPKQVLLYRAFGAEPPEFGHLPLMLGTDRAKLSKRTGDTALQEYREKGFPKEAIVNFLCLQGWALDGTTEVFGVEELVKRFDIKDVNKAGAIFDVEKFLWLGGEYIRRDSVDVLAEKCVPFVVRTGLVTEAELRARWPWYLGIVAGYHERVRTYGEFAEQTAWLFASDAAVPYAPDAEAAARKHEGRVATLAAYLEWLRPQVETGFDAAAIRDATKAWVAARGLKMAAFFAPFRVAISGVTGGPDVFDMASWLGPRHVLARLEAALARLA